MHACNAGRAPSSARRAGTWRRVRRGVDAAGRERRSVVAAATAGATARTSVAATAVVAVAENRAARWEQAALVRDRLAIALVRATVAFLRRRISRSLLACLLARLRSA